MKHLRLPLCCLAFMCQFAFAQASESWQDLKTGNGVNLSYQISNCNGTDFLFFKVANSTDHPVSALYSINVKDGNGKILFVIPARPHLVEAGKIESGSCNKATSEFSFPLPAADSYTIELINLTIH